MAAIKKESFEVTFAKLEEIAEKLSKEGIPLEESINLYEKGIENYEKCKKELEDAKQKIEVLTRNT